MRPLSFAAASLVLLAAASVVLLACLGCGSQRSDAPDVLLVVLDTVRADHLSTYGYHRPTSPRLDALAGIGVVFEDVTAPAPWTWPSHATIFTGEPPWVHGAHLVPEERSEAEALERFGMSVGALRADLPTLAERFAERGYRTDALVVNDWLAPELGLMRGFERVRHFERDAQLFDAIRAVLAREDDRPLFLFVNVMTAHSPFRDGPGEWALGDPDFLDPERAPDWVQPYLTEDLPRGVHLSQARSPEEATGVMRHAAGELVLTEPDLAKLLRLYDASVRGADHVLGGLLDRWIDAGREGVVAVTSDHGEGFGEHGMLDHRVSVYPEVLRVPLVIAAPGRLPAGRRIASPVALQSLYATLLDLSGAETKEGSLLAHLEGHAAPSPIVAAAWPDPAWARHAGGRFAAGWQLYREGRLALVTSRNGDAELYDLAEDPHMERDLSAGAPERVAALRTRLRARVPNLDRAGTALVIPAEIAERLGDLGYAADRARH